ncbi:SHOCT domain-containing protein [Dyadobacter psychrotolerans]|uniref:SHOCT domain-containing protein n=1 Tax=Dyadobacter psychrotolerans TaxID=2541721 RepID=A0A4R5DUA4_9BACT|nr:SHOCT domain-containing protein [Dyadobacter psychrotolerans]TDE18116.1 SHOCT domain-containing protein [Dyadobacter psychrotolerans]
MMYNGYSFWGMHMLWWIIWMVMLFWIFATPYNIPGQKRTAGSPLDILQKRFAAGKISNAEYQETKATLTKDLAK